MALTNIHGIPQSFVDAIEHDDYSRGNADISISQLVNPPRLVALAEKHKDELTEDASEGLWRLLGKAVHKVLADGANDALVEERLYTKVCTRHSIILHSKGECDCADYWTVSGAFDHLSLEEQVRDGGQGMGYHEWVLRDHKVTSSWTRVYGDRLAEWESQINLYSLLLRESAGIEVSRIAVNAIYRDWTHTQALRSADYPKVPAEEIPLNLWPAARQEAYLMERVRLHQEARENLPDCTPEEKWQKPAAWAVMKVGRKSALRVLASRYDAIAWGITNGLASMRAIPNTDEQEFIDEWVSGVYLDFRPGENTRCREYCPVRAICEVGIAEQKSTLEKQLEASVEGAGN